MGDDNEINALLAPLERAGPLTVAVMVTSADGRATVNGRVGDLTGDADQRVLLGARELAAAVVVGGSTVRNEGYERLLSDAARARRRARGLEPEPELLVITRSASGLPPNARPLSAPQADDGSPNMKAVWDEIRARHPDGLVVCEGGPTLLTLLASQRLLDQLVLCISPRLVGGDGKRLIEHNGAIDGFPVELEVLAVAAAESFVSIRYGAAR